MSTVNNLEYLGLEGGQVGPEHIMGEIDSKRIPCDSLTKVREINIKSYTKSMKHIGEVCFRAFPLRQLRNTLIRKL